MLHKTPIPRPDRIRKLAPPFGWVDARLTRSGLLCDLTPNDLALYLFLVLAADRLGISHYRLETLAQRLGYMNWSALHQARDHLVDRELVAFQPFAPHDPNGFYQVLSLDPMFGSRP